MWQDTTKGDGGADECVEFLVTADGELQMTRRDALDFEILGGVAGKLENFGGEVFEDRREVDGSLTADAGLLARDVAEVALYATARELQRGICQRISFVVGLLQRSYVETRSSYQLAADARRITMR